MGTELVELIFWCVLAYCIVKNGVLDVLNDTKIIFPEYLKY